MPVQIPGLMHLVWRLSFERLLLMSIGVLQFVALNHDWYDGSQLLDFQQRWL